MTNRAEQTPNAFSATVVSPTSPRRALLDTTVQLDRRKTESRKQKLEALLAEFGWKFSTGISPVEFKATVIQECLTIHSAQKETSILAEKSALAASC